MPVNKKQKKKLEELGARVRAVRTGKGLTIKDLANIVDKESQSIQRLETGGVNPGFLYLLDICKGLEIDIAELLKGISE